MLQFAGLGCGYLTGLREKKTTLHPAVWYMEVTVGNASVTIYPTGS
jgi:hypothetical protein